MHAGTDAAPRTSQRDLVVDYIDRHGHITSMAAYDDLGVTQLATRIFELKELGFTFTTTKVKGVNRRGQPVDFVEYRIAMRPGMGQGELFGTPGRVA